MNKLIEKLKNRHDFYAEKRVSVYRIEEAEKMLNLIFADDFEECISEFGAISVNGHELTGFSVDKHLNVIEVTLEERENNPFVPSDWYVIEQAHIDGIVVWQNKDGEIYETFPDGTMSKIADNLYEYIFSTYSEI